MLRASRATTSQNSASDWVFLRRPIVFLTIEK